MSITAQEKLEELGHDLGNVFYHLVSGLALLDATGVEEKADGTPQPGYLRSQARVGSAILSVLATTEVHPEKARSCGNPPDLIEALRSAARLSAEAPSNGRPPEVFVAAESEEPCPVDVSDTLLEESLIFLLDRIPAEVVNVHVKRMDRRVVARFDFQPRFEDPLLRVARSRIESLGGEVVQSRDGESVLMSISFAAKDDQGDEKRPMEGS